MRAVLLLIITNL